jgi:integrase
MAPRPRKTGSKDLPPNLYRKTDSRNGKTYFTYRDPETGRVYGLGSDKDSAIQEAHTQNQILRSTHPAQLSDRVASGPARIFSEWVTEYRVEYGKRGLAASSVATIGRRLNQLNKHFGQMDLKDITTFEISGYVKSIEAEGKSQMAKAMRSLLQDLFREAMAMGWATHNPVTVTRAVRTKVQRQRLSLELWKLIHVEAPTWLKRAMEIAILTGQRREDIHKMQFREVFDGALHVVQAKTHARLRISVDLTLDCVGLSLKDLIKTCRDSVVSKNFVHHGRRSTSASAGNPVSLNAMTMGFAAARDKAAEKAGIVFEGTPPSFHEMRSLSARLHTKEGRDPQRLLGHKNAAMTDLYKDGRGTEWIDVAYG